VDYCAKLGRHRDIDDDVDLFTVLPTSRPGSTGIKERVGADEKRTDLLL
jgi:hypothetical protein